RARVSLARPGDIRLRWERVWRTLKSSRRRHEAVDSLATSQEPPTHTRTGARMHRGVRMFRVLTAALWTLAIMTMCWIPDDLLQEVESDSSLFMIPDLDKVVHWGIFAAFSVLWLRVGLSRSRYLWVAVGGIALAAVTEIVQTLPWIAREGEVSDF